MNFEQIVSPRSLCVLQGQASRGNREAGPPDSDCVKSRTNSASAALVVLLLGWWLVSVGYCGEADDLIGQALKRSGVAGQLKSLIPAVVAAFPGDVFSDSRLKREAQRRVEAILTDEILLEMVKEAVRKDFDRHGMEQVLAFYGSKLGRKVGELQSGALTPSTLSEVRGGRKALALMPRARLALYKRIVQEQQVPHTEGRLLKCMITGLAAGSDEYSESRAHTSRPELRPLIDKAVSTGHIFEQMAVAALAGTLKSLSDKELEDLAAYEQSDAAQWFRRVSRPGLEKAVYKIARELGQALRELRSVGKSEKR